MRFTLIFGCNKCWWVKLFQVVDETDRLLGEAYQSWLPTVLQLTHSSDESFYPHASNFLPFSFNSLKTRRRWWVLFSFTSLFILFQWTTWWSWWWGTCMVWSVKKILRRSLVLVLVDVKTPKHNASINFYTNLILILFFNLLFIYVYIIL